MITPSPSSDHYYGQRTYVQVYTSQVTHYSQGEDVILVTTKGHHDLCANTSQPIDQVSPRVARSTKDGHGKSAYRRPSHHPDDNRSSL